jgi:ribosomal protein S5
MIGIKDLAAKVEGSTNTYAVLQAFLLGLLRQVRKIIRFTMNFSTLDDLSIS